MENHFFATFELEIIEKECVFSTFELERIEKHCVYCKNTLKSLKSLVLIAKNIMYRHPSIYIQLLLLLQYTFLPLHVHIFLKSIGTTIFSWSYGFQFFRLIDDKL